MYQATEQSTGFLKIDQVRKTFGQTTSVDNFNLSVKQGEFVSFLGPSGCGKTTTLRMIAGFERPTSGRIVINNVDITEVPANKRKIGMVFQSYALFPNMTAAENIQFGLKVAGQNSDVMQQRVTEMLELIHLPEIANRYPHQLSGGQQQRVALARALAFEPQVLLMDEPLSALDAKIRVILRQEIRSIQRKLGITAIYVTHDQEEALSISDRVVVMNKGRAEQIGTPTEIYNTPQTQFVASFIGTLNLLTAHVVDKTANKIAIDDQHVMVNQSLANTNGHALSVTIRPEAIRLGNHVSSNGDSTSSVNQMQGNVEEIYFLGSVVRIHVRINEQALNVDTFNDPRAQIPSPGDPVVLSFSSEACRVLADQPMMA